MINYFTQVDRNNKSNNNLINYKNNINESNVFYVS